MLSDQLKQETQHPHQTLEKRLITKIKAIRDTADYVDLLRLFYGYYQLLENRIDLALDKRLLPDHVHRRKARLLLDDIRHLQSGPPYLIPASLELPEITDHLQAMGALYVLECSALGGKIISGIISGKLELTTVQGLSFFEGYGKDTWRWWDVFKKALDVLPKNATEADRVIETATDTFVKFYAWIEKYESESSPPIPKKTT